MPNPFDEQKDILAIVLQELLPSIQEYLEESSKTEILRAEARIKIAESFNRFVEHQTLGNSKKTKSIKARKKTTKFFDEHHQEVFQIIKEMRNNHHTYNEIAICLNEANIPKFSGGGNWSAQTVYRLYKNNFENAE